ncbi:NAD+ synthase [Prolixibacter sp. SD074]|jgi:NAD+ synthase (glutamine-hydrolysing)|uniref:NAD+ synthase n=1 Tax=Prolixibacter sp. SD074 TaxID=2652391 RepID=UPI0012725C3F|nr:NAD+ synthase [Prolixibacter sp. SD074]GET29981.1 NAD+ synthase [Prolixibacter sp. SD074]
MKIALAQLNYHIGNFQDNKGKIIRNIGKAREAGAELVVFSELSVTGYYPHDLLERKEFIEHSQKTIEEIARHCTGIAALVGGPGINRSPKGKMLYNSAFFLKDGKIESVHHKTLLPTYDVFDEYRHFEPNHNFELIELNGKKLAVTICEDLWYNQPVLSAFGREKLYAVSPMEEFAKQNPDLVINLSASPFSYNQEKLRKDILLNNAHDFNIPIVYVNQVGAQTEIIFDGGSLFIDANGDVVDELAYFEEDFRIIDTENTKSKGILREYEPIAKMYGALILGIKDYFGKMDFKQATLGLSGGIDSAVTVVLAARALGPENVRVLLMPSKYSSGHSIADARDLAENLGIQYEIVNIHEMVDAFDQALAPIFEGVNPDVTEENIQARIRGTLMMAISNKFGHILLNTSNKSEAAVGYGTLYGDMNGGLSVLGDVYKSDVFALARFINREHEVIPENTIIKPPSAELRPDQKDSDSLPDYDILDKILFNYIELAKSPDEIIRMGFDEETVHMAVRKVNMNEYKRFQTPPILRISSKAFGFGRKMPLVAKYPY